MLGEPGVGGRDRRCECIDRTPQALARLALLRRLGRELLAEFGEPLEDGALDRPSRGLSERVELFHSAGQLRDLRRKPAQRFFVGLTRGDLREPRGQPLVRNPGHLRVGVSQPEELVEPPRQRARLDMKRLGRLLRTGERRGCGLVHVLEPLLDRGESVELSLQSGFEGG